MLITAIRQTAPGRLTVAFEDGTELKSTLSAVTDLRLYSGWKLLTSSICLEISYRQPGYCRSESSSRRNNYSLKDTLNTQKVPSNQTPEGAACQVTRTNVKAKLHCFGGAFHHVAAACSVNVYIQKACR